MLRDLASRTLAKTDMAPTTSPSQPRDTSPEPSEEQASKRRRTDATTSSQPTMVEMPQGKGKDRANTQDRSPEKLERDARAALPKYGDITPVLNTAQKLRDTKERTPARVPEHINLETIDRFIKDISTIDNFKRNQNINRSEVKKAMERVQNCDEHLEYKSGKTTELIRTIRGNPQIQAFLSSGE
jgi:hypothetical protein